MRVSAIYCPLPPASQQQFIQRSTKPKEWLHFLPLTSSGSGWKTLSVYWWLWEVPVSPSIQNWKCLWQVHYCVNLNVNFFRAHL